MKIIELTEHEKEVVEQNTSLSSYLAGLNRGRPATPHSWLYENESADTTLQRWLSKLKTANESSRFGKEFTQFDLKQVEKFGPQGEIPPVHSKECMEVIEPLFSPELGDNELALQKYFLQTKAFARAVFGPRLMTKIPLSFEHVVDDMRERDTLNTKSGWPRNAVRSTVQAESIEDARSGVAYTYPAIALFRHYNGKLRPVWMTPMSMNLIEFSFANVIQDALRASPAEWVRQHLSPWEGYEDVKSTLTKQWRGQTIVGGDTTKMDAHMRPAQLRLFYELVKWLFQRDQWDSLYRSIMHVTDIPLVISATEKIVGTHGLASGSGWTQLSETVLVMFLAWLMGADGQGIGDDFYVLKDLTADEIVKWLWLFLLPANPSKQTVSKFYLDFLQRRNRLGFFSRDNPSILGGYYPTIRALNSSLWPERFHKPELWSSDMFCVRQYMILENTVDDPCFPVFLPFVVHGQKDLIAFAKQKAGAIDAAWRKSKMLPGLNPSYNQEKREKPLSSFTAIRWAAKL